MVLDDDCRVVLKPLPGHPEYQGDYINASYVDVSHRKSLKHMLFSFYHFLSRATLNQASFLPPKVYIIGLFVFDRHTCDLCDDSVLNQRFNVCDVVITLHLEEFIHTNLCDMTVNLYTYYTTGPLPKTVVDFWRLVWQERPPSIVMITNLEEGGKIKCQRYWPESGHCKFGPFEVTLTDKQILADYTIRKLEAKV